MPLQTVTLSSVGSLTVALVALLFGALQAGIAVRRKEFAWSLWGAAVALSTFLYALAVFLQYNAAPGPLNHFSEKIQYSAFLFLIHAIYGFTFSYLSVDAGYYHRVALPFHLFLLMLLWFSDVIVSTEFVRRNFLLLSRPYVEPKLGPLGPLLLLYVSAAALFALSYWIRRRQHIGSGRSVFIFGLSLWTLLGLHDALVTMGAVSIQFLMEYGFFGFTGAIVYATARQYLDLYDTAERTRRELAEAKTALEKRVQERTLDLVRSNEDLLAEIAERKRAEQALIDSEKFLDDVIESIQDGISVLDLNLTIRHVNGVMKKWYAENLPLEGKKCFAAYHNRDRACDLCPTLRCLASMKTESEIVPGLPGSSVEWVELFSYPILDRNAGRVYGVVEFVRDITQRVRMEAQLRQAERMDSIGRLAGGVAHDFNNLLMGIQGRTSLMLAELDDDQPFTRHLRSIEATVSSAAELTQQLLGVARGGKYAVQTTDLNELLEETLTLFWRTRKEMMLDRQLSDDLWPVDVDRSQIRQVFLNLFINAWEAMPRGGSLSIRTRNRRLGEETALAAGLAPGKYVRATVSDTGIGMTADTIKHIFDPFFTTKAIGRGTGLGLASAYGIIENHHGCIDVQSEPGLGTRFSIYLPASNKRAPGKETADADLLLGSETILLVDDEEIVLEVGEQLLAKLGYRVLTAKGGMEAVRLCESDGRRIDAVILDMIMPGLGGGETFDALRSIDPDVRVLLSSGYSFNEEAGAILKRGARGFIQKPFSLSALSKKIREVIDGPSSPGI